MRRRKDSLISEGVGHHTRRIGTLEQFVWLRRLVGVVLALNVADALFTIFFVTTRRAKEANPLLAELSEGHPFWFATVKISLVSLGSYLLWKRRKHPWAVVAIFLAFLVYYLVLLYHLSALDLRLLRRWL